MQQGPRGRAGLRARVGEDHVRGDRTEAEVMAGDHDHGGREGVHVLVETDEREYDEEMEVQVGKAAAGVHERGRREDEPDGDDERLAPRGGQPVGEHSAAEHRGDHHPEGGGVAAGPVLVRPGRVAAVEQRDERDDGHVQREQQAQDLVTGRERGRGQADR
ncbi:hypothetical protein ACFQX7_06420 [Luedemannella flava]